MPQMVLPVFPAGVTEINRSIAFEKRDGKITYFHGCLPVFSHDEKDIRSFRMIISQFYVNGHVKQAEIVRAFGVTSIFVKRSIKIYRERNIEGFYEPKKTRGAAVLTPIVLEKVQQMLDEGLSLSEIADKLEVKSNTINKAILSDKLHRPSKKKK